MFCRFIDSNLNYVVDISQILFGFCSEASSSMNFENVKHGGRAISEQSLNRRTDIAVDNKFSALSK